jgi:hypothetical protein
MTVGPVKDSPGYVALMQQLATSPIKRMTNGERPPLGVNESDRSTWPIYVLYHAKRYLNKLMLRPASPETRILAEMVSKLSLKVVAELGTRVKAAVVASPDRNSFTEYEIEDIFDYLWIENLMKDKHDPLFSTIYSLSASLAGYSQGLCANYTNAYYCTKEERHTPSRRILHLDFSDDGLRLSMDRSNTARQSFTPEKSEVYLRLSSDHRPEEPVDDCPPVPKGGYPYWNSVQTLISDFVGSTPPETLLLTGESASDPCFIQAVKNALASPTLPIPVMSKRDDSEETTRKEAEYFLFATAMGAAEMAKRRQEGMARCWLPDECRNRGDEERKIGNLKEL